MEIERKFTVNSLPENLSQYPFHVIEQAYLNRNPVVRVRREDDRYYMTYKGTGMMVREEYNLPLDREAYEHLARKADGVRISKRRYLIPCAPYTIELDIFDPPFSPLVIAEVEFPDEEQANCFVPPDWFEKDVTQNPAYHNSNLQVGPFILSESDAILPINHKSSIRVREMTQADIPSVLPFYLSYYNEREKGCWTPESAGKRIRQVLTIKDSFSLLLEEKGVVLGFAMGYFKQYDDITGYYLDEIILDYARQNQGIGSAFLSKLESIVRERGASCIELQAVKDQQHEHFYTKAGYHDAQNFVMKVKWFPI